jgi:hypothetical protein
LIRGHPADAGSYCLPSGGLFSVLGRRAFVGRQIVRDDDVAWLEGRGQLRLDIGLEDAPIHWRVDHERRGRSVAAQSGDEGLRLPMSERGLGEKSTRGAPTCADWKVALVGERDHKVRWTAPAHKARVVWRGADDLDLGLLQLIGGQPVEPKIKPELASYDLPGPLGEMDAAGFPEGWASEADAVRDYFVRGNLRIASRRGSPCLNAFLSFRIATVRQRHSVDGFRRPA